MHHWLRPDRPNLHAHFSSLARPVLTIDSGDTVSFATPDVSWGLEPPTSTTAPRRKVEPRDPAKDNGPCLCGPVAVRGAMPGDTLEILMEHVRPSAWGWTYAGNGMANPAYNSALGLIDAPLALMRWELDADRRAATNQLGHSVAVRPFPGTIGLSPAAEHADGWTPRATGGNMDCRELIAGTMLLLPVEVEGGLLSIGDGHAAQGDGEMSGTAIECAMEEVRVRLTVLSRMRIKGPRIKTAGGWATLGFGSTLDAASMEASSAMLDLLQEELGLGRSDALALASAKVDLRITQQVNPLKGVHAVFRL
ncbi:MAG: acetamidase/formamidase family protein [Phycisphaerales bacterium]